MPDIKVTASYDGKAVDKGLNNLQKELAQTSVAANKLDSTLGKSGGVKKAGTDFTALSRVIQDLPFGFIGIQNNITQLLPAAGALGLVISAVTSALTFAQVGTSAWSRKIKENKEATDQWEKSQRSALVEFEKQKVTIASLVEVVKSDVAGKDQQARALDRLNKIIPDNIGILTKQNIATAEGTKILSEYTKAIEARGIAELLSERIAQLSVQLIDGRSTALKEVIRLQRAQANTQKEIDAARARSATNNVATTGTLAALQTRLIDLQVKQRNLLQSYGKNVSEVTQQIASYRKEAIAAFTTASPLDQFSKDKAESAKRTIQDVLADLRREIDFLSTKGILFNTNEEKAKIQAIQGAINTLIKSFNVEPDDTIIAKLLGDITLLKNRINPQEVQKAVTDATKRLDERGIVVPVFPVVTPVAISEFLADATAQVESAMNGLFEGIATSIGETLGAALAGSASIGDFFKGIFNQLGQSMVELGKFFIQTGIQIKLIKDFLIKNPALAIAGGIALVALGSLLKNKTAFATGGTFQGGGSFLAGERGPEIITAPRGTVITPNAQTNALLGSGGEGGEVVFRIGDRELIGVLVKGNARLGRNGQL